LRLYETAVGVYPSASNMAMNLGNIYRWRVAVLSLASVFCAGLGNADGAVIEREYNFSLDVGFESATYPANTFGYPVNRTDERSTIVEIDPFDTALGDLEQVTITFSTTGFTYNLSLTTYRAVWGEGSIDPGNIKRELSVTSLDSRVTMPEEAKNEVTDGIVGVKTLNSDIEGAPVSFLLSISDGDSLEVFKEGVFQFEIGSVVRFYAPVFTSTEKWGEATVSSTGNYAGTVTVAYQYAIPEPSAALLLGSGPLAFLAWRVMRRARSRC